MSLPVIQHGQSRDDLVRLFYQTENRWRQHLADEQALDVGTAYSNAALAEVYDANNLSDVALPEGMSPAAALELVADHYEKRKTRCAYWTLNPSAPAPSTKPLAEHLLAQGYHACVSDIMLLMHAPRLVTHMDDLGLTIIPARASFRHARMLFEESAKKWNVPQLAEAGMRHMDDPHWDALLALKDGEAVAHVGVLAVGEVGRIDKVYVAEKFRRRGIGGMMMGRILEVCARSLLRHVMLSVFPDNEPALRIYHKLGFERIGRMTAYYAPG